MGIASFAGRIGNLLAPFTSLMVSIAHFYRAMLCMRGTSHGPVSVSVCLSVSQVGVLLKRLNIGSHKQNHTIAQGLWFFAYKSTNYRHNLAICLAYFKRKYKYNIRLKTMFTDVTNEDHI